MSPVTVIGPGRVGQVFARCARAAGRDVRLVGREGPIEQSDGPRFVCTRAEDLDAVLDRLVGDDVVFVQNGLLGELCARRGLRATIGVIWFAATSRDGHAVPGAPSVFHGPRATDAVRILRAGAVDAREEPDPVAFAAETAIKLAWNAIYGLCGERFGEPVEATAGRPEARLLAGELAPVLAGLVGAPVDARTLHERGAAYARAIAGFRASVKELPWRNGLLARAARARGLATPLHDRLLAELGRPDVDDWR